MRVHRLVTGEVRAKAGQRGIRRYLVNEWRDEAMPINVFLIEHPGGLCLFDTGQTARAADPRWFPRWHPFFRLSRFELGPGDEAAAQLRSRGIDPSEIGRVVLSHLHTDHVGGLDQFGGAEVFVSRLEWDKAVGMRGRLRAYLPQCWPPEVEPTLVDFDGPADGPFSSSFDIAGDGRLSFVPTPGHTPGHAALLVRDDERAWLLIGDLAHTAAELDDVAPAIATWCRDEGVTVLAAHDSMAGSLAG